MDLFLALRTLFTPGWWVDAREQGSASQPFQTGLIHQSDGLIFRDKVLPEGTTFGDLGDSGPVLRDVEVEP
jgi:hypothetical protein